MHPVESQDGAIQPADPLGLAKKAAAKAIQGVVAGLRRQKHPGQTFLLGIEIPVGLYVPQGLPHIPGPRTGDIDGKRMVFAFIRVFQYLQAADYGYVMLGSPASEDHP